MTIPLLNQLLPVAAGNITGTAIAKVQESAAAVIAQFNGTGSFSKVAASAPTLNSSSAAVSFRTSELVKQYGDVNLAREALAAEATSSVQSALELNSMSEKAARNQVQSAQEASVSAVSQKQAMGKIEDSVGHFVRLEQLGFVTGTVTSRAAVFFENMPEVTESRTVEYEPVAPPQFPGAFQKYKGTSSTQWSINATLTSRTTEEATKNLGIINRLRGWTMPYFGENTKTVYPNKLGAPPDVLVLTGFRKQMIGPVPVVITSLNWTFPQDVDYIPANETTTEGEIGSTLIPFPTVMKVAIQLVESFSTEQFNGFNLADFRVGQISDAFRPLPSTGINDQLGKGPQAGVAPAVQPAQTVAIKPALGATSDAAERAKRARPNVATPTARALDQLTQNEQSFLYDMYGTPINITD